MRDTFYFATMKKIIVAFATIFDDIRYHDGFGREIAVPLHYSPRSKFVEQLQNSPDMDQMACDTIFPKLGFEMVGLAFAPERHTNPLAKISDVYNDDDSSKFMFNRVPYDFTFDVNIGTVKFEDSLKIVEQIVPFFTPELTITIKDKEDFRMENNIPVVLNSSSFEIDYLGSNDTRRTVLWTLNFTVKGYLYSNVRGSQRIKETIMNFHNSDYDEIYERLTSVVVPREANKSDPHIVVDKREDIINDG